METTPAGTRLLLEKYLRFIDREDEDSKVAWAESVLAKMIGPGNSVVIAGRVVTSHSGFVSSPKDKSFWLNISNRIGLDNSNKIIEIETPFDSMCSDDEEIPPPKGQPMPKKKKKKKKTKK